MEREGAAREDAAARVGGSEREHHASGHLGRAPGPGIHGQALHLVQGRQGHVSPQPVAPLPDGHDPAPLPRSILARSLAMWVSTVRDSMPDRYPHTSLSSSARETRLPRRCASGVEQVELQRAQVHLVPGHGGGPPVAVDLEVLEAIRSRWRPSAATAGAAPRPGRETRARRPASPRSRRHPSRNPCTLSASSPRAVRMSTGISWRARRSCLQDLVPAHLRQHEVEHDQVRRALACHGASPFFPVSACSTS